jgi:non-ribosomal peptide synthetase component F
MKHVIIKSSGVTVDTVPTLRLLHNFFEAQALLRPTHPAVECGGESLSYAELDTQADKVAALLRSKGAGPGSLIALYMSKSCRLFAGLLGILKAGAGYVPLDTKFPVGRILAILEDAEAKIVLCDENTAKTWGRRR